MTLDIPSINDQLTDFDQLFTLWNQIQHDSSEIVFDFLKSQWLGRGWAHVSAALRDAIAGMVWEIYANAFEHARSPVGIFSCGQHFPSSQELKLTVVDFGFGIPYNVRSFFKKCRKAGAFDAANCLKWVFQSGTTTNPVGTGRGMGLDLLKEFVKINHGRLEIFSHNEYGLIDEYQEVFIDRDTYFRGALFNITFRCDESYYQFAHDKMDEPLFFLRIMR